MEEGLKTGQMSIVNLKIAGEEKLWDELRTKFWFRFDAGEIRIK